MHAEQQQRLDVATAGGGFDQSKSFVRVSLGETKAKVSCESPYIGGTDLNRGVRGERRLRQECSTRRSRQQHLFSEGLILQPLRDKRSQQACLEELQVTAQAGAWRGGLIGDILEPDEFDPFGLDGVRKSDGRKSKAVGRVME